MLCREVYGEIVGVWSVIGVGVKDAVRIRGEVGDVGTASV